MDVITGAMSTLLPKLGDLLKEEYKLQKRVRGEIMFLQAELESMQTALLEISEAPIDRPPNRQVKLWAREVRELSYDLEDKIDKFLVRIDHTPEQLHGLMGFIDRSINLLTKGRIRHKIGTDIRDIKTRIKEVRDRRDSYKIDNVAVKPTCLSVDMLRQSVIYKKAADLIGTEEKTTELVKILMEEGEPSNQQLKEVSIVGVGGLGKTTLANAVYEKLKEQFDCGAFVSVSLDPKMDQIFKSMLYQINRDKYGNINGETWEQTQLIKELRDLLRTKRYFIVIDDLWSKSVWENIRCALIENNYGSRIITTTRILDVAKQAGHVYQLKPLSPVDSTKLFYLRIFGAEDRCPPIELASVSDNILRKCGGVPLAIITIASMLASNKENGKKHEYWSKVYQSMGSGLEDTSDVNDMRRILSVSYYDLPPELKTCLLYLCLYPEDYEIPTEDLIWKWIGEGFVHKKQGMDMFEVGEYYIRELINRSLIQPSHINDVSNKPTSFRIHDMVLDLITFLSNEEQFLTKLGAQEPESLPNKLRRLSLQTSNQKDDKNLGKKIFSHVRSLVVFDGPFNLLPELPRFPVLRVLDLRDSKVGNDHFKNICNLFHLRYLALCNNGITEIPKDIGNLKFLQVLDLGKTEVVELPSSFVQLQQLVYLKLATLVSIPDGFGCLKCLRELIGDFHLKSPTTLHALAGMTRLRRLSLIIDESDESFEKPVLSWLSNMVSLKYLTIKGGANIDLGSRWGKLSPGPQQLQEIRIYCAICSVPRWMSSLCSLSILRISLLTLAEEDLQILGSIPSLSHLAITMKEPTQSRDKELLVISNIYPFLCLTKFEIYNNMEVMFTPGAMQNLQTLKFFVWGTMDQLFSDSGFDFQNLFSGWMSSLYFLSELHISLLTLGDEDLQTLGSIPSLSHLAVKVKKYTQRRDKELLVIGNLYPFLSLKKFEINKNIEVMFAQGAMQKLQSLNLSLRETMVQFGDTGFGLENLSSLEHVSIDLILSQAKPREVEEAITALQKAVDMNPNKPRMKLTKRCVLQLNIDPKEQSTYIFKSIRMLEGIIDSMSIIHIKRKLTVCGMVDPTAVMEKLEKDGIVAEPWEWDVASHSSTVIKQTPGTSEAGSN